ncbi:MAG: diacylglycerol/lipid kinase family protein [Solirubrobacteraceae bacterium]
MSSTQDQAAQRLVDSLELPSELPKKRALVIANPYATTVSDRLRNLVVYALRSRYEVEAVGTQARGHATEICREAAHEGYDVVIAFGGDGTVNEVVNGLAGSDTPVSCLPGGATNVYCKLLGIPGEIVDATEHLLAITDDWKPRTVDLGRVNERYFAFSSGLGVDASVVRRVDEHPRLKARLGAYYFTYAAVTTFTSHYLVRPPRMVVTAGGEETVGVTAIVQNGPRYTYFNSAPIELAEGATLDGGTLSSVVLRSAGAFDMPSILLRALSPRVRLVNHRKVSGYDALENLLVRSADERPLPLHVDGDYVGDVHEARYAIVPGALRVVA